MKRVVSLALIGLTAFMALTGCTVVEKDATPDTTVVTPPADKPDVVVNPPAGSSTVTTGGGG